MSSYLGVSVVVHSRQWKKTLFKAFCHKLNPPDSEVHGANMGPTWGLSAPDGPHVGPMNLALRALLSIIWDVLLSSYGSLDCYTAQTWCLQDFESDMIHHMSLADVIDCVIYQSKYVIGGCLQVFWISCSALWTHVAIGNSPFSKTTDGPLHRSNGLCKETVKESIGACCQRKLGGWDCGEQGKYCSSASWDEVCWRDQGKYSTDNQRWYTLHQSPMALAYKGNVEIRFCNRISFVLFSIHIEI